MLHIKSEDFLACFEGKNIEKRHKFLKCYVRSQNFTTLEAKLENRGRLIFVKNIEANLIHSLQK